MGWLEDLDKSKLEQLQEDLAEVGVPYPDLGDITVDEGTKRLVDIANIIRSNVSHRGVPQSLDSFGAELRWKPPAFMPPVSRGILPVADCNMPHTESCRPAMNADVLHCNA